MSKVEKLDLMGVTSLAAVAAVLLVGWIATSQTAAADSTRHAAQAQAVSLGDDGSMKLTVTAERGNAADPAAPVTRTASARSQGQASRPSAFHL